ncbi:APC family permease [Clostridium botulinum]|uniref:Amino acid permease family protein n=1 Tax=Clostridium botulinum (strain Langeland / NCTC 10281 / Type F) TaxID=441772 RepID=A7GD78_CLOBL|nr:amino acid permease [Clostridium botulinum]ABS39585.1 amino acid permease family protein [Clostridium botulinum F str. Langeland]ADF99188.1 amino acid permease family protein [Clostridium botulinum F str. 230613]KKM43253.1 amino acid permease [Clostridium botulinum]MBY6791227.1 amino acid permease [Clostridium botulinum]MBY6936458.1 amino acid permease [Clostridium botulinum]
MKDAKEENLQKNLGLFDAIAIVIGMVIGSGIFFKPAIVFKNAGSPMLGILAWLAGGVITIASGLTVAEIAAAIPKTGGIFVYIKELYGEKFAFLLGWVQSIVYIPGSAAALSIILSIQITSFIPLTAIEQKVLAIAFIIFIMILNIISTKLVSKMQGVISIAKLIPIIAIIALGFINGTAKGDILNISSSSTVSGFGAALLGTLWAYDGWISVGNMAGELKNPKKDLPRSIIIGLGTTIVVYVLINLALINIMPMGAIITSEKPASDAAVVLLGSTGAKIISAGILISIFGALNGYLMTGVRIPLAMSQDRSIPFSKYFSKVHEKSGTPVNAFIFETVLACLYVLSGSFNVLTDLVMFVLWIFFTMAVAGIFVLRTKFKHLDRPYKVPLYPLVPLIGIIGSGYIIISTLITNTFYALCGIGITLLGLPVYSYIKKQNKV